MEKLYVIKFEDGTYFYGYNQVGKQLRKAKIYKSLKFANESGSCMRKRIGLNYTVKQVEICEVVE